MKSESTVLMSGRNKYISILNCSALSGQSGLGARACVNMGGAG